MSRDGIARFWELLVAREADLAREASAKSKAYDELLCGLQEIDEGLFLELSVDGDDRELVVTADGDADLFPLVREVVAAAPAGLRWSIRALKPKLGFPETASWEGVTLKVASLVFIPLERDGSDELGLRIFVPGLEEEDREDAHNAVLRAMDHGLGEEAHAENVHFSEVRALREQDVASAIALTELEGFIAWRRRKRMS